MAMNRNKKLPCLCFTVILTLALLAYFTVSNPNVLFVLQGKSPLNTAGKPTYFLIFDAVKYKYSLQFLDNFSSKWRILVVNSGSTSQIEPCTMCQVVNKSWSWELLEERGASQVLNAMPRYARDKALAILYALKNSADWLYVTDSEGVADENTLLGVCSHQPRKGPVYLGPQQIFEPCEHFMDPYTWHGWTTPHPQGLYSVKAVATDAIHMVVNSCYQKQMDAKSWEKAFSTQSPRPYVMAGTFSSINFHNVIVSRKMSWALVASLLPKAYESQPLDRPRVSLNLLIQRIVWETEGMIGFVPTSRTPTNLDCASCEVNKTFHDIGLDQIDKLSKWRCTQTKNLLGCLKELADDFLPHLLSKSTSRNSELAALLRAWLDLFSSGKIPMVNRIPLTEERLKNKSVGMPLRFTAPKSMHLSPTGSLPPNVFADLCKAKDGKKYTPIITEKHPITDILLVIVFNYQHLVGNIARLDYVYGRHFKHVVYCAESTGEFKKRHVHYFPMNPVTFLEHPTTHGYEGGKCMAAVLQIGYQVPGFLQISDDVIMNVWNIHSLPRSIPWFQSKLKVAPVDRKVVPCVSKRNKGWIPWTWKYGQKAALEVYNKLQQQLKVPESKDKVSTFLQNLHNVSGCQRCLMYETADIFYLPARMASDFVFFTDFFSQSNVFLEIAIPSVLVGMVTDSGLYRLRGNYLWYNDRDKYPDIYTEFDHFLHAWKMSKLDSKPEEIPFYCNNVLARIDSDLKRLGARKTRR